MASSPGHAVPTRRLPATPARQARGGPKNVRVAGEIARHLGAISILIVGAIHAQQYYDAYFRVVPTIGTLFLLSFIGAGLFGAVLLMPVRRLGDRLGGFVLVLAALGAIAISLGTLVSLLISEYTPLFGFMESGYRLAVLLTLVFDGLTTLFLGVFLTLIGPQLISALKSNAAAARSGTAVIEMTPATSARRPFALPHPPGNSDAWYRKCVVSDRATSGPIPPHRRGAAPPAEP